MKRGLLVELLGGIGDVVFILPALDALRDAMPDVTWDILTFPPGSDLLEDDSRVGKVWRATRRDPTTATQDHPPYWFELAKLLDGKGYQIVVSDTRHSGIHELIEMSPVERAVTQLWSGARLTERIPDVFVRRLWEEGLTSQPNGLAKPRIGLVAAEREEAARLWREMEIDPGHAIVLNPHAGLQIKRWSLGAFGDLGEALSEDGFDMVILEGDRGDNARALHDRLARSTILPRRPLRVTAACLERIGCFISADSGLAHVASAVGAPVVAFYGPTSADRYGVASPARNIQTPFGCGEMVPMDFTLQRCWQSDRCVIPGKRSCSDDVDVATVLDAVRELVEPV